MSDKITRLGEDENDSTALQLYGFTALRLYGFTPKRSVLATALSRASAVEPWAGGRWNPYGSIATRMRKKEPAPEKAPAIFCAERKLLFGSHLDFGVIHHVVADPLRLHVFRECSQLDVQIHLGTLA
jgi:hypothetical protein